MKGLVRLFWALMVGTFAITHLVQPQDQLGFISLDCGLPANESPYTEPFTNLTYTSDAGFIRSGKTGRIQKDPGSNYMKPYTVLRYFPDGIRNCYDLSVRQDTKYLINTLFVYGNYDGRNSPPRFDLYLGPNFWATVDLQRGYGKEEIVHVPRTNTLGICLVKTGTTLPLISAIELRPLKYGTYVSQTGSLKSLFRQFFSTRNRGIRFPDDVHDRDWFPYFEDDWTEISTNQSVKDADGYEPPRDAVITAATPANASEPLIVYWPLESPDDQVVVFIHFAEIQSLKANEIREFNILANGKIDYGTYSPNKFEVETLSNPVPLKCDGGECRLLLLRTQRSTLPPLINAMEIFSVIEFPQSETDQNDVAAMKNIQAAYGLDIIGWQGDPCAPKQFMWDGLNCSIPDISTPPRIVSLDLSSRGLSGAIAPSIQNLTKLQQLDLSNNNLTGGVPEFLANIKSLLVINLSGNNLTGSVPQILLDRVKEGLKLNVQGNQKLCDSSCKKKFPVAVAASVPTVAIIIIVSVIAFVFSRRKMSYYADEHASLGRRNRRFTYSEVTSMTNNFERVLGKGGFGVVNHGFLNDSEQVAVKVLSQTSAQGYKQFKAEVELLLRVHHVNLVSLVGYCNEGDHLALIYEYMANGNLQEHMSGKRESSVSNWATRLRIAAEAALGLEYLHIGCKPPIIHRDVKSANILLDENFQAKLADFGLSRSFPVGSETHVSTDVVGTFGYLDPE
ncbi:PREDICTED: leucine-rich repeat receptor-like serine/threonine-protein kinase At2g14510 [Tarenaya hassleriana]|uniref:leucine-rich repeat receptor-like serine/threonine-protein kinase At2g14510 n=1 Tax=Tarenaya hassleriana TaxID=28532 RepID=UPI0008FD005E|nr:PREDICTED: leucine-rich repeat receptor-like serine/threonine-protein kinase At2g14510 [Tarenaya hassleriana]